MRGVRVLAAGLAVGLSCGLTACGNSQAPVTPVDPGPASAASCTVAEVGAELDALPKAEMIRVRQKFFGTAAVDPDTGALPADRVIASWVAVTTYAVSLNGHVVLFDAFIGDASGYVPTDDCELTDLRPEAVFVGHGHNDHARLLATVANRNRGVPVYSSEEVCIDLELALSGVTAANCTAVLPAAAPLGSSARFPGTLPGIDLEVVRLTHSAATEPQNPGDPSVIVPVPVYAKPADAGPCFGSQEGDYPPNRLTCPPLESPDSLPYSYTQDGLVSVLFQFQMPNDLNLTWFNSFGPTDTGDDILTALEALPQTDIQLGSILGLNGTFNGFLDVRVGTEALRSRLVVPGHHDYLPRVRGLTFEAAYAEETDRTPAASRPGIVFMSDPEHYLVPERLSWSSDDPAWQQTTPLPGLPSGSSALPAP